ncbi:MAG: hypothetical protein IJ635_04575 [Bacteroidaceae bacterium]|nr:hypothetical protein [Bacteroidaceae bacterium]
MKKFYCVLMGIASLAIVTACGEKKAASVTGDEVLDQKLEKAEKKLSEMTGVEQCEATWAKRYGGKLTVADVQPDFDYEEVVEGFDCFMGNGVNIGKAVYRKKGGAKITSDEWKAYVTKIYGVTKKLAADGKVRRGFGSDLDVKTRDQALEEKSLETILGEGDNLQWAFLKNDLFEACYLSFVDAGDLSEITLTIGEGTQKNFEEALKDAEKYLKD